MIARLLRDGLRYGYPKTPPGCRAHFHYNVDRACRGLAGRCGLQLMHAWYLRLRALGHTNCGAVLALRADEMGRRYRSVNAVYDARKTTVYRNVDPREFYMVTIEAKPTDRYWQRFEKMLREQGAGETSPPTAI